MNECHRLGIKNFQSTRQSRRIQLTFDLCTDDAKAPRSVSSKGGERINKFNYLNEYSPKHEHKKRSFNFIINIFCWIFRMLCLILKYKICLLWCLLKMMRCTIYRIYPIRCSRHHYHRELFS